MEFKSACFFGHREVTHNIRLKLAETIKKIITEDNVTEFYVGHQGQYDSMVYSVLKELKVEYPQISYTVVLAYMPNDILEKCTVMILSFLTVWKMFQNGLLSAREMIGC